MANLIGTRARRFTAMVRNLRRFVLRRTGVDLARETFTAWASY